MLFPRRTDASGRAREADVDLGPLPEWRLDDLYSGTDSAVFAADSARAVAEAKAFAAAYRGKLEAMVRSEAAGDKLGAAVSAYEALQDLVGRIISYAGLVYAGDTSDPARAKFYGDVQQKATDIAGDLLFFELELNRLDDALIEAALAEPRARRAIGLGSRTSGVNARISSTTKSNNCFSRNRSAARRPGIACSTRRFRLCASSSRARS